MLAIKWTIVCAVLLALPACPSPKDVQCRDDSSCDLSTGGTCTVAASGNKWCAYPDSACASGFRFSDLDVGDGVGGQCTDDVLASDAGVDVMRDGGQAAFDIAYPDEWKFSVAGPISGYMLIVNTSVTPLNTSSLVLKSISDDHPTALVRINVNGYDATISPGEAGGSLSMLSKSVLVDSGLVTETRSQTTSDYLTLEVGNAPSGTYDIHATLVLSLDNLDVTMPMTIHILPGPDVWADPEVGKRLKLYR
jgi:hypothetical protein